MEIYSKNVCELKQKFTSLYNGNSHTTEILPNLYDESFLINSNQTKNRKNK